MPASSGFAPRSLFFFANPFPGTGSIPANPNINAVDRDRVNPYFQQWNFTIEGEVLHNTALRVSYVGDKGTRLERLFNINDPPPAPGQVQPRRPFQPFGPIGIYQSGRSTISNQVQLGALRRFTEGFAFRLNTNTRMRWESNPSASLHRPTTGMHASTAVTPISCAII